MEASPQPIEVGPSSEAKREIQAAFHEGILTAVATKRLQEEGIQAPTSAQITDRMQQIIQETTGQDAANVDARDLLRRETAELFKVVFGNTL